MIPDRWRDVVDSLGVRFAYPRIMGVYLAVNALPDLWMLVDSPDCASLRGEFIQLNHDWNSSLLSQDGRHRIASTGVSPDSIALDRRENLAAQLRQIAQAGGNFICVATTAISSLVGVDYEAIYRAMDDVGPQYLSLRSVDSLGDWVSGYCQVLEAMAVEIHLEQVPLDPDQIAIVGYLWDRNEADHRANLSEMKRLLATLGLRVSCVWLSGEPSTDLARVASAATIIEMPYAGNAARSLAARTGAGIVRTDLPIGVEATLRWLEEIATATNRQDALTTARAEADELAQVLFQPATRFFAGREFAICTEGYLAAGLTAFVTEMGGEVRLLATSGREPQVSAQTDEHLHAPPLPQLGSRLRAVFEQAGGLPVFVGNEQAAATVHTVPYAAVFLGFQSPGIHRLYDSPFLGFRGALWLTDQIVNAIPTTLLFHR